LQEEEASPAATAATQEIELVPEYSAEEEVWLLLT
jgi:hypothetical protein